MGRPKWNGQTFPGLGLDTIGPCTRASSLIMGACEKSKASWFKVTMPTWSHHWFYKLMYLFWLPPWFCSIFDTNVLISFNKFQVFEQRLVHQRHSVPSSAVQLSADCLSIVGPLVCFRRQDQADQSVLLPLYRHQVDCPHTSHLVSGFFSVVSRLWRELLISFLQ